MKNYVYGRFAFKTDVGKIRVANEDQAHALINAKGNVLLCVLDGMGGQNKGDLASALGLKVMTDSFREKNGFKTSFSAVRWCKKTIRQANKFIYLEASKNREYRGMGTTLTVALIVKDHLIISQIGDSRCYMLKDQEVKQLTEDQTYVAYLNRIGQISKEEMKTHPKRHILMNALGVYPSCNIAVEAYSYHNETLLLCSDGLYNNVPDADIFSIVKGEDSCEQKVNELISLANSNGGSDNIAVVLWEGEK